MLSFEKQLFLKGYERIKNMTIKELISELEKIENKDLKVFASGYDPITVDEIIVEDNKILLEGEHVGTLD